MTLLAHTGAPARGAPFTDILPAAIVAVAAAVLVGVLAVAHRRGRTLVLRRAADGAERVTGLPGWAALPSLISTPSLFVAAFGFYWDVAWHIDRGRDPGPLANPAHWFILVGLAGVALAGVLAVVLGEDAAREEGVATVRLPFGLRAPVGSALLALCGLVALAGFPLDDAWHRLFGQDVTLWGPTHVQMIGGASLATLALWSLDAQARAAAASRPGPGADANRFSRLRKVAAAGAFLIGMSTLQGEFDFGVPQFRQLYHPVLIALAAGVALVPARIRLGRGGALGAVAVFVGVRGLLALLIGPALGRSLLHFPLYLAEALVVEAVAARVGDRRQLTVGAWSGLGIGTVGLAAEWAWSHVWMPLPWRAALLPEAVVFAVAAGVAGGVLGGLIGRALAPPGIPRQPVRRGAAAAAWVTAFACVALPLPMTGGSGAVADVALIDGGAGGLTVAVDPPDAARGAEWFTLTAWQGAVQGDGGLVVSPLRPAGDGRWATSTPVPTSGNWKALLRLHTGRSLQVVPVYLPADAAIPAPEVAAPARFTRPFVSEKAVLQREAVGGSVALQRVAYALLGLVALAWVASLGLGLRRIDAARSPAYA